MAFDHRGAGRGQRRRIAVPRSLDVLSGHGQHMRASPTAVNRSSRRRATGVHSSLWKSVLKPNGNIAASAAAAASGAGISDQKWPPKRANGIFQRSFASKTAGLGLLRPNWSNPQRWPRRLCAKLWALALNTGSERGKALDLDADAAGVAEHIELFDADPCRPDPPVDETKGGDLLGQGFDKTNMPAADEFPHAVGDALVTDDVRQVVVQGPFVAHREIKVDANALGRSVLVSMNTDAATEHQIANEDMTDGIASVGDTGLKLVDVFDGHRVCTRCSASRALLFRCQGGERSRPAQVLTGIDGDHLTGDRRCRQQIVHGARDFLGIYLPR
jgi:hypothetical protein